MRASVELRNNATGEVRIIEQDVYDNDLAAFEFCWTEGNMSCDCNRGLYFARAKDEPEDWERECGHEAFTAIRAALDDGRVIELDDDEEATP